MISYETAIGLEVHVELKTQSKVFCECSTSFGAKPNTQICPTCMALPGSLPYLNEKVVEHTIAVGLACNCSIRNKTYFDRKNYFYPDNPHGYQISQLYFPICENGHLELELESYNKCIYIEEIHMEEDAGKLIHDEKGNSLIDYNRAGLPLIELVTRPDMSSAEEVLAFLEKLRLIIQYLDASDCKLNEGSMRVDVNLSVKRKGEKKLGTRTEMKNLNSFRSIRKAIENEQERQISILENNEEVLQETRRWDESEERSYSMRIKKGPEEYAYFPDPDLLPLVIEEKWIEKIKASQPELREEKINRYTRDYKLPQYDAEILTSHKNYSKLFEDTIKICGEAKEVSNWIMVETMRMQRKMKLEEEKIPFSPENLALLVKEVKNNTINRTVAKEVFEQIFINDINPLLYIKENNLGQETDEQALHKLVENILEDNPQSVEDYKNGKDKAFRFLVGQAMKASKGKGNPEIINRILKEELNK